MVSSRSSLTRSTLVGFASVSCAVPARARRGAGYRAPHVFGGTHRAARHTRRLVLVAVRLLSAPCSSSARPTPAERPLESPARTTGPAPPSAVAGTTRPNIVVVMADDMRADDVRFMPAVRSLLGGQGAELPQLLQPLPVVLPGARVLPHRAVPAQPPGLLARQSPWGFKSLDDHATLATALQSGGYHTGFVGKYLNGYGRDRSRVTGRSSFTYTPNGWTDWYGAPDRPAAQQLHLRRHLQLLPHALEHQRPGARPVEGRLPDQHDRRRSPARWSRSTTAPPSRSSSGSTRSPRTTAAASPTTRRRSGATAADTPTWSRRPGPGGCAAGSTPTVKRAPGLPVDGSSPEANVRDKPAGMHWGNPNAAERTGMRDVTRQRAEALYVLDQEVRRLVAKLKDTGEWPDTVFVFTSDNGYFLGEHRLRQGKIKPHEPSVRVPLLMAGKGIPHGERFDPVTTPGLTATVAELAGVSDAMPFAADGVSVVPTIGQDRGWDVPVVVEAVDSGSEFPRDPALKAPGSPSHATRSACARRGGSWSATPTARPSSTTWTPTRTSSRTWPTTRRTPRTCRRCSRRGWTTRTVPARSAARRWPSPCAATRARRRPRPTSSRGWCRRSSALWR